MREDASVMHVDADSFFASVETRQKPSLARTPVLVGGTGPRGVVATANYEARAYGCRSAMSMAQARVLCPTATVLTPRFPAYAAHSALIMDTLRELSPLVQPVSLDEAFVDLAAGPFASDPVAGADLARRLIYNRSGLVVSVGLGRSKLIAKLASDAEKPHGFTVVTGDLEDDFLLRKPVAALSGVGPATDTTLRRLGIVTVAHLRAAERDELVRTLGEAAGWNLYRLARGDDPRPVVVEREAKSVGAERTFAEDLRQWELPGALDDVLARALRRLQRHGGGARTVTVKVRLSDFTTVTRSVTVAQPTSEVEQLREAARGALTAANPTEPVRLLGVALSGLTHWAQLRLPTPEDVETASRADGQSTATGLLESTNGRPPELLLPSSESPTDALVAHPSTEGAGALTEATTVDVDAASPSSADSLDDDEERLPAPLTVHTCSVGLDVAHEAYGAGWIARTADGVVTVRFEGPGTEPGPERTFDVRRELLMRIAPPAPCPPRRLTSLPSTAELTAAAPPALAEGDTPGSADAPAPDPSS
ncbi:DNA polymerase IV [Terrabacter aerolatus]|uniref:DNA polymerase IV n=1 Tax=Terrabacter aerolatus TaxID=422442 RepID=A0A512CYY0_9MICO|nr:DNA polymerase IV [Terrabacter aerolatus]